MGHKASDFSKGKSNYVKSDDVKGGPIKFVIDSVEIGTLPDKSRALVLVFDGGKKFTLNKTNNKLLQGSLGDDTDGWIRKAVVLYFDPSIQYAGNLVGGIRVKVARSSMPQAQAPPTASAQPSDGTASAPSGAPSDPDLNIEDDIPF